MRRGEKKSKPLGDLLREIRQEAGVSIKSAAPRLRINYTYLSKIENGRIVPSAQLLIRMAQYFSVSKDELFCAANRVPPDVEEILRTRRDEAVALLRKHFSRDSGDT